MPGLKVVALISGGKDSLFSILHCNANGHQVVALANLHPPLHSCEDVAEDTDSFMYQTIGHAVIPLYEEALGLPLYRQEITGSAVDQRRDYGYTADGELDETESLVPLLLKVKVAHPDVNAISTGAILSDYQRTRVESVALRFGLTPLAYLWQWPSLPPCIESSLLEDMAAVGQDSRMVKVASGALDDSFLWQNVADTGTVRRLTKASARFGSLGDGAILGEGGEYETLAIQGPAPLWKGSIAIDEDSRVVVPGEAGSFSLRLSSPKVVPVSSPTGTNNLRIPPLLDGLANHMLDHLSGAGSTEQLGTPAKSPHGGLAASDFRFLSTNCTSYNARTGAGSDAAAQMRSIMDELAHRLIEENTNIVYTSIILRNMADFADVNEVYGSYFSAPNPPARITLSCADVLPGATLVMVGITCMPDSAIHARRGLHVQSRSYWAPANIGPYSQAISVPVTSADGVESQDLVHIAGQIPLDPASMELSLGSATDADGQFRHQAVLALQHMRRVGARMRVSAWVAAIVFMVKRPDTSLSTATRTIRTAWQMLHDPPTVTADQQDEDEGFDVWDLKHRHGQSLAGEQPSALFSSADTTQDSGIPPLWTIKVDALPRGASVEWVGYGTTSANSQHFRFGHLEYLLQLFRDRIVWTGS